MENVEFLEAHWSADSAPKSKAGKASRLEPVQDRGRREAQSLADLPRRKESIEARGRRRSGAAQLGVGGVAGLGHPCLSLPTGVGSAGTHGDIESELIAQQVSSISVTVAVCNPIVENAAVTSGMIIREARLRAGLSQAELSAKSGKDRAQIARWERDVVAPSFETLRELVRACGFELSVALGPLDESSQVVLRETMSLTPKERLDRMLGGTGS